MQEEIYDKYTDTVFGDVNILTEEQFEKASAQFEDLYGEILPIDKDARILDIGSGTGHFLYYLKKKEYGNFLGIDISPQQVDYCKKNITEKVEIADCFEYLKEKKDTFDFVSAHDMLEHVQKDRVIPLLKDIFSALKKGGIFAARVPNMDNPLSLSSRYGDFTHEVGYTYKSLLQVLRSAGFDEIKVLPSGLVRIKSFPNLVRKMIIGILHGLLRFSYYVQDFTVPEYLDKNIVIMARKK